MKEQVNELKIESMRMLVSTAIGLCKSDDDLVELCVVMSDAIDTIRKYINERHDLNVDE